MVVKETTWTGGPIEIGNNPDHYFGDSIYLANNASAADPMSGYMEDIRVTKAARYTSNFNPADQLSQFGETYSALVSTWDTTTTTAGDPGYTPKFGIASAVFDGDGDKLTVTADNSFTFAADEDYTVEGWVKTDQVAGNPTPPALPPPIAPPYHARPEK